MKPRIGMSLGVLALAAGLAAGIAGPLRAAAPEPEATSEEELAGVPQDAAKPSAEDTSQEVVIRGESRVKVEVEKPEPDLIFDVDEIAEPYVVTEDFALDVSPTSMAGPAVAVTSYLSSSQTASPHLRIFERPPILHLRPRYNAKGGVARWRLRITDAFGNVFKDFTGKGSLPDSIVWDGRSRKGEMLDVGVSYSYIFSVVDRASNPTSQMGRPVLLESLLFEKDGVTTAKVTASAMFGKKGRRTVLAPKGELYCREIADVLMADQNYPLQIDCYAKDVDMANTYGEIVQEYLMERLIMPKKRFAVKGHRARNEKIVFQIR